jgi:hypothetical protein
MRKAPFQPHRNDNHLIPNLRLDSEKLGGAI